MSDLGMLQALQRIRNGETTRILAFGSSNTERYLAGLHWFDGLDLAIRETWCQNQRRMHHCINAGIGGNTTRDLLERFDRDAAVYRPHLAIITIGGNDANPVKNVSAAEYRENLRRLAGRFADLACEVVFQTYYAVIPPAPGEDPVLATRFERFHECMQMLREEAAATGSGLIDHLARWEPLRRKRPDLHAVLMRDAYHVNELGNKVLALHVARAFGLRLGLLNPEPWGSARICDALLDALAGGQDA